MRALLLAVLSSLLSLNAFADAYDENGNLMDPPGVDKAYNLNAYVSSYSTHGWTNLESHIRFDEDGKTVYFKDICPAEGNGAWVKGEYINENTIRVKTQTYYTEVTESGTLKTELYIWYGKKAGETQIDYYDFIVSGDTIKYADADAWVSLYDPVQGGAYEFDSELCYTPLGKSHSTDMITKQPEGDYRRYMMQANVFSSEDNDYWAKFSMKADVIFGNDGNIYFKSLTPDYPNTHWVKGTYDRETGLITVQPYQAIEYLPQYNCYTYFGHYDRATGEYLDTPIEFIIDENGVISALDEESTVCAMYIQGRVIKSLCALNYSQMLTPIVAEPVVLPESAMPQNYVMTFTDYNRAQQSRIIALAFDGEDVYFQGLNNDMPKQWVKGHIDGDKITIPNGQLYEDADSVSTQYMWFQTGYYSKEDGYPVGGRDIVFDYDAKTKTLRNVTDDAKEASYIIISYVDMQNYQLDYFFNITMSPQTDWEPANPSNPSFDVECHLDADEPYFMFYIPTTDVNGGYLDPANLYYSIYFDGDIYTFEPSSYIYLGEATTEIPFNYSDSYDITANGTRHLLYIHYTQPYDILSIQSIYKYGGKEYKSEMISRNYGPYIEPDGIEEVKGEECRIKSGNIYNLYGEHIKELQKGVNIVNGKKLLVR